jgi:hypothetical protein
MVVRGQREIAEEEVKALQCHNDMVQMMRAYLAGDSDEEDSSDEEEGSSDEESDGDR